MKQNDIISLRREIHKYAEISNNEFKTSERITNFINKFNQKKVIISKHHKKRVEYDKSMLIYVEYNNNAS